MSTLLKYGSIKILTFVSNVNMGRWHNCIKINLRTLYFVIPYSYFNEQSRSIILCPLHRDNKHYLGVEIYLRNHKLWSLNIYSSRYYIHANNWSEKGAKAPQLFAMAPKRRKWVYSKNCKTAILKKTKNGFRFMKVKTILQYFRPSFRRLVLGFKGYRLFVILLPGIYRI